MNEFHDNSMIPHQTKKQNLIIEEIYAEQSGLAEKHIKKIDK